MNPKVSIVVPIYKVEKYLPRCIESILDQSYKNVEIILVNDGSPDNCGKIAENYSKSDRRIKVIHKKNGGLSDARNYGMGYVTGEYTFFVDSDDWLDKRIIEELVRSSKVFQADVVQAAFYYAYDDCLQFDNRFYMKGNPPVVYDNQMLMGQLVINEKVKNFAWGKLYRTDLIRDIPFRKGVLFEDVFWAHRVMQRVKTFVMLNDPMYYYFQREDSIVATYSPRNLDIIQGLKERHVFIEKYYKDLADESFKVLLKTNLIHYNLLLMNKNKDKRGLYRKDIQLYIKKNYSMIKKAVSNDPFLTKQLLLFRIHPYLNVLFLFVVKVLRKISLISQPSGLEKVNFNESNS